MPISLACGPSTVELDIPAGRLLPLAPGPTPLADPAGAAAVALEAPVEFPALRRALTPDDRVCIALDPALPARDALLRAVLGYLTGAGLSACNLTLLLPEGSPAALELPPEYQDARLEVHAPDDRDRLAYLATTGAGRRVYLNRTLVDADQAVVLTTRRFDPLAGHGGAESTLYPALADRAALDDLGGRARFEAPGDDTWPARREAQEVTWLLGQPFFLQALPASEGLAWGPEHVTGPGVAELVAGAAAACRAGDRRLDALWRRRVPGRPSVVVAALGGPAGGHSALDLALALHNAARVVQPDGRVILLCEEAPELDAGLEVLRRHDEPADALKELERMAGPQRLAGLLWARAARSARLALRSRLADDLAEELFTTPLTGPADVQRLVAGAPGPVLVLPDAHLALPLAESP